MDSLDLETFPLRDHARFELLAPLGRGSMGIVYRVHDRETGSEVALKTLAVASAEELYRLKGEFRVLADIVHPNLVGLYELFLEESLPYFTMEFIEGEDFVEAFRGSEAGRPGGLAAAAAQLAAGVSALHAAGRLHRDIKPSNVLVTAEGRTVILDFGLTTAFGREAPAHYGAGLAGTFAYMAPEILTGAAPSPAADWYSVGTLLHEALTGRLPVHPALPALPALAGRPMDTDAAGGGSPLAPPWNEVVPALLDADPSARIRGAQSLMQAVGASAPSGSASPTGAVFVGREAEMNSLRAAIGRDEGSCARVVHVVGASGIGKSELVRRVFATLEERGPAGEPPAIVLSGRCHPQEAVPYKAFDGAVDRLSRILLGDDRLAAACVPDDAGFLLRLFPVLGRVPALAEAGAGAGAGHANVEPIEVRRRGFVALRALFSRLADHGLPVLWIDDLQWSDLDSILLLRELLKAPAPPLRIVTCSRSEDDRTAGVLQQVEAIDTDAVRSRLDIGPLGEDAGAALVRELGAGASDGIDLRNLVNVIVRESGGNPFLLCELARALAEGHRTPALADVVTKRLGDLSESARALLEVVSVAGGPVTRSVALEATGLGERGRPLASSLEKRSLLRTITMAGVPGLEIYHDRIRESVVDALPADRRSGVYGSLADVLALQAEPDPESLYRHSLGAGRRRDAGRWAETAGDRAAQALAFQRAADLFGEALALQDGGGSRHDLRGRRAEALANAGRALEAAHTYLEASRGAEEAGPGPAVHRLRERAATHYLQTGHLEEGLSVTRDLLRQVGVRYPRSQGHAMLSSLWNRARLARRGFAFEERREAIDETTRLRLDALWNASISLTMVDQASADALGVRHLLEALDSGDPLQAIRAIGGEAGRTAQLAGRYLRHRCARLADTMEELVNRHGGAFQRAHLHSVRGMIAFQSSLWRRAHRHFDESSTILRRECLGVTWEQVTIDTFRLSALAHMGELGRLADLLPVAIGDAADRGDLYASLLFHTGVANQVWLARDEGNRALAIADEAMARWPASSRFQVQHYVHLLAAVNADLYRGDPWSAFARVEEAWPRLKSALFLALESARVELRNLRARVALAAAVSPVLAVAAAPPDPRWNREKLLGLVAGEASRLARIGNVVSSPALAGLLDAGLLAARGRTAEAAATYERSAARLLAIDMKQYAAAAAQRAGELGDAARREERLAAARRWAENEGVQRAERMYAMLAPG